MCAGRETDDNEKQRQPEVTLKVMHYVQCEDGSVASRGKVSHPGDND